MSQYLQLRLVRDGNGKSVGFHFTTGADAWGEGFIEGFLLLLYKKEASVEIGKSEIVFSRRWTGGSKKEAFSISEEDAENLRPKVAEMIEKIRREPNPATKFKHLSLHGSGFRIVPEGMENLEPEQKAIRPGKIQS